MTYGAVTRTLITQAKNKLAAAHTKMERSVLNITYRDRKTNSWLREKTKVTDVIEQVRRRKWTWAVHVSRIRDNRWTLRITTWKPYKRKRSRGWPAKRWRDELDDYWKGSICILYISSISAVMLTYNVSSTYMTYISGDADVAYNLYILNYQHEYLISAVMLTYIVSSTCIPYISGDVDVQRVIDLYTLYQR